MADTLTLLLAALSVLAAAVFAVALRRILTSPKPQPEKEPDPTARLAARKVYNEQMTAIGETVRVTPTHIVVKAGARFLLVPRSHLQEWGPDIVCDDGVDWKEAESQGEAWRREQADAMQDGTEGAPVPDR
jgi:hypothetical protein